MSVSKLDIPQHLRAQPPTAAVFVVDERLHLVPLFRALAEAGYTVINNRAGQLVLTQAPGDFR